MRSRVKIKSEGRAKAESDPCRLDSRSTTPSCPRRFWAAVPRAGGAAGGMGARSGHSSPSPAPGAREGLETRAAAALEVKQINQSLGDSLSAPPPSIRCFWGETPPRTRCIWVASITWASGGGTCIQPGRGRVVGCPQPLDAPKKHQSQPRIKGKSQTEMRRRGRNQPRAKMSLPGV